MSHGIRINLEYFTKILSFCDRHNIEYKVWNAEDILMHPYNFTYVDLEFDTQWKRDKVFEFYQKCK